MTDSHSNGRIDLRAVDAPSGSGLVDRVVAHVLDQATQHDLLASADLLTRIGRLVRPAVAIAAFVIVCAIAMVRWTDERAAQMPVASLSDWTQTRRVPTNGELVAAFKGYER